MAADVRTFWGALLSVLLKCIAALGFNTPDRAAARRQAPAAGTAAGATARIAVEAQARGKVRREARGKPRVAVAAGAPAPAGPSQPENRRAAGARIPAPRAAESRLVRRSRGRTLPPTMKQRIGAEAHGASPSARSLPDDAFDPFGTFGGSGDLAALGATAVDSAPADTARTARDTRPTATATAVTEQPVAAPAQHAGHRDEAAPADRPALADVVHLTSARARTQDAPHTRELVARAA